MAALDTPLQLGTGQDRRTNDGVLERRAEDTQPAKEAMRKRGSSSPSGRKSEDTQPAEEPMRKRGSSSPSGRDRPMTSGQAAPAQEEDEVCWPCKSGGRIKTSHTYRKGSDKYIHGATKEEMVQAARGGNAGRSRLLEKLKRNVDPAEDHRQPQVNQTKGRRKTGNSEPLPPDQGTDCS